MTVRHLAPLIKTTRQKWGPSVYAVCGLYRPPGLTVVEADVTCKRCRRARCWPAALAMNAEAPAGLIDMTLRVGDP